MHGHPNDNGPKIKLKNVYGNARMNWMRHHGTLKFTPTHMNSVLVETWEYFKPSFATITQEYFKKTHLPPLLWRNICTNRQSCLSGTQMSNLEKADDIGHVSKTIIEPIEMKEVRKTDPLVILREKGRGRSSRNLLIRAAAYDTLGTQTVLPLHQIKTAEREMKRQRMVRITSTPG